MGTPTYRYHATKAPRGLIFDTDDLPSEEDGWFDSPKRFRDVEPSLRRDEPEMSGEFPDPRKFASVKAYVSAVDPTIPVVPTEEERAARGVSDEDYAKMISEAVSKKRRALLYYARLKHETDLAKNSNPEKLFAACVELDG